MIDRFKVATRATGRRREVFVHIYDDIDELKRAHAKDRGKDVSSPEYEDMAGGLSTITLGYHWPHPDGEVWQVMRLWVEQLTTSTIAHEATHAAACMVMYDAMPGWDSRLRTFLNGDNEALAYAVGDIAAQVTKHLYRRKHIAR